MEILRQKQPTPRKMARNNVKSNSAQSWEATNFLSCVSFPGRVGGLRRTEYKVAGKFPVFDQGQEYISGYTDREDLVQTKVPAILFGDHTRVIKFIDHPYVLGADGTKMFWPREDINPSFLYQSLLRLKIPNTGYNRHFKWLKEAVINMPPISEQKKIAEILGAVDEEIAKTDEIIAATQKLKMGLMHDIFNFSNKKDVQVIALGDLGKVSMCKRIFKEETSAVGEIPFYKIGTFGKEPDAFISREIFDEYRKKFSFPRVGDVLLSASGTIGRKVKYDGRPAYFQDSNIIWLEHDESKVLNSFLFYLYDTITWQTEGSTIKRLYNNILLRKKVPVPSIDKQRGIVEVLSAIDEKISVNQKLKEKLTLLKKGLTQDLLSGEVRVLAN